MLPENVLVVRSSVPEDIEDAWNTWYTDIHLPEILECPGFHEVRRYVSTSADGTREYVSLYRIDGPEVLETEEFAKARGWREFTGQVEFKTSVFSSIAYQSVQS